MTGAAAIDVLSSLASFGGIPVPARLSAVAGAAIPGAQWCSVINGQNDPGALDVQFDIQLNPSGYVVSGWVEFTVLTHI